MAAPPTTPPGRPDVIAALARSPLLEGFTETGIQILASVAQPKSIPAGAPLFVEQMIGDSLYIIAEGRIALSMRTSSGQERVLTRLEAPASLGEAALLRQGPRKCSAKAEVDTRVLEISRRDVVALQRSKPQACLKLMMKVVDLVGERLRAADDDLRAVLDER